VDAPDFAARAGDPPNADAGSRTPAAGAPLPEPPNAAEIWGPGRRGLTIGLVLNVVASAFEALAVATVLPTAVGQIGGLDLYGWAFSAFMLTNLVGISVAGGVADERGPALPLVAGTAAFVIGLAIAGVAPAMPILVAGRAVQGLGAGAIAAIGYAAVGRAYSPGARPRMLALLSTAWVVPGLIGPAIAGLVSDAVGWRWVFFGIVPMTVLGAALSVRPLARLPRASADPLAGSAKGARQAGAGPTPAARNVASLALACGTGVLLLGLDRRSDATAALAAIAGIAIALPATRTLLPPGTLVLRRGLPAAIALMGTLGFSFFGAEAFLPLSLSDVRGQPAAVAGLPLTAGTLAWTLGAWLQAREASRRSRRVLIAAGLALLIAGIAGIALVLLPATPLLVAAIAWGLAGLGMGVAYSTAAVVILESAPPERAGEASAALQLAITLGIAIGTGVGGAVLAAFTGAGPATARSIGVVYALAIAAAAVGLLAALRLPARPARAHVTPAPSAP